MEELERAMLGIRDSDWEQAVHEVCTDVQKGFILRRTAQLASERNRQEHARSKAQKG